MSRAPAPHVPFIAVITITGAIIIGGGRRRGPALYLNDTDTDTIPKYRELRVDDLMLTGMERRFDDVQQLRFWNPNELLMGDEVGADGPHRDDELTPVVEPTNL